MIPTELKERFAIRDDGAVRRGDHMFAYGAPCRVADVRYDAELCAVVITCIDIITAARHHVELRAGAHLTRFEPERRVHRVIMVDAGGVLTDTDDTEFSHLPGIAPLGAHIYTIEAPRRCGAPREWRRHRAVEKIIPGAAVTDAELIGDMQREA